MWEMEPGSLGSQARFMNVEENLQQGCLYDGSSVEQCVAVCAVCLCLHH